MYLEKSVLGGAVGHRWPLLPPAPGGAQPLAGRERSNSLPTDAFRPSRPTAASLWQRRNAESLVSGAARSSGGTTTGPEIYARIFVCRWGGVTASRPERIFLKRGPGDRLSREVRSQKEWKTPRGELGSCGERDVSFEFASQLEERSAWACAKANGRSCVVSVALQLAC